MSDTTAPKYPEVHVRLTGNDGNAFAIMGRVSRALREAGHGADVAEYRIESMDGDYNNLLRVATKYVTVS
ncbi:hypothetical protein ART_1585 [Arthrobacter sp. PAMC 25486]|uniref:hypothetical protein n=1 Tax=Arthrobacter sp. PAMC 25486 TaxID=1494608 RepID=UPI0005363BE3|nr:hypothetical protein [Arthrobacter sp. PAMC 25486]AIY01184.1 hypothetical protein ART_1585 [Arthrobacter sp. PAMC 25486]